MSDPRESDFVEGKVPTSIDQAWQDWQEYAVKLGWPAAMVALAEEAFYAPRVPCSNRMRVDTWRWWRA